MRNRLTKIALALAGLTALFAFALPIAASAQSSAPAQSAAWCHHKHHKGVYWCPNIPATTLASASSIIGDASATTKITNRPDSGVWGPEWAVDNFTRKATVTLQQEVPLSNCGGASGTGHCYLWTGRVNDSGTFTTVVGDNVPGNGHLNGNSGDGVLLGEKITQPMKGWGNYSFFSTWKTAKGSLVPTSENDQFGTLHSSGDWVKLFFGPTAKFFPTGTNSGLETTFWYRYTEAAGSDIACPSQAMTWTDSSWPVSNPDGAAPSQGNILASNAAHC